jgi:hypothetical protein
MLDCGFEHVVNVAVVTAFAAHFALLPPNCLAGGSADATELTFCVGGRLAQIR